MIPEIETKSPAEIKRYQEERLQELLSYLNRYSPFYSKRFREYGIDIRTIHHLEDLSRIPVTTKDDLQKDTESFLCVDRKKIIDYNTTSGTLGDPVTFVLTEKDIERLTYNEHLSLSCGTIHEEDIVQLMVTLDRRFMAGVAYCMGLRKIGAGMVRVGPGNTQLQFDTIHRIHPTAVIAVPSFLVKLSDYARKNGIDINTLPIKKAICIGEPIRNSDFSLNTLGKRITSRWDIRLFSTYASTEMATAFTECEYGKGGHHHPEMIIVEFLDENDRPVPEGEAGEVVITTLGVEAMPLLRFKTGDICHHYTDPCNCGRTTLRIGPVIGRKQQMIKYKGTTLYPNAIYDILNEIDYVENYIVEVSTGSLGTDELLIRVGVNEYHHNAEKELKDSFRAKLRVAPQIMIMEPEEIVLMHQLEQNRKPRIFLDKRKSSR